MTLKFDRWPWKTIGHLSFATSRFVHHFIAISKFKLELRSPETLNSGQNRRIFGPCDVEIWPVTLKNNTAPVLYYFKLCASFHSHKWIQTGVRVRKRSIWVKIVDFLAIVTLKFDPMTFKNNRAPLLCYYKLCASFHSHQWIQTGVKSPETLNSGQNRRFFVPCDLEIWQMTLKNNRAPVLC